MSWKINGQPFHAPSKKTVVYNTQSATNRTLSGANNRDYIGAEKMYVQCEWAFISSADFAVLKAQYDDQRANPSNLKTLIVDELGINMACIIDLMSVDYPIANHYEYRALKIDFIQQ